MWGCGAAWERHVGCLPAIRRCCRRRWLAGHGKAGGRTMLGWEHESWRRGNGVCVACILPLNQAGDVPTMLLQALLQPALRLYADSTMSCHWQKVLSLLTEQLGKPEITSGAMFYLQLLVQLALHGHLRGERLLQLRLQTNPSGEPHI
jgi:hypothetical protein